MPYNQTLAQRIHMILGERPGLIEKKMFGGVGFMLHGNMVCGVLGDDLIARVGIENSASALSQPFVKPFMGHNGKPMTGWVSVALGGLGNDQALQQWVEKGYAFAQSLPEKKKP
jgi:TfoX/Sxy family transcriptional regulator of competence genes